MIKRGGAKGGGRGGWTEEGRREFMRKFGKGGEGERGSRGGMVRVAGKD